MNKSILCMNCFRKKGRYEVCPYCGYVEGTPQAQSYFLASGTVLANRYLIGTCIGFGGFGITYRAYDTVLNIQVAIKEFYPAGLVNRAVGETKVGVFSGDKEQEFKLQLERFLDEARNMAIFSKERDIVNVYHFFEANGTAYTIMEYIEGILLKKYLKDHGKMEVQDAVSYMLPILDALDKIHRHGIIHKDISPDNIFLTGNGTVKIFDFGAARFPSGQQDKTFSVVIKAGYAPPEQYLESGEQGAFMDIYAAGAVFYEMVTGVKPGEGSDRFIKDDLELPSKLGVKIDRNLERIIMKAMAVKPEYRFQTAEKFKKAIEKNASVLLPEDEIRRLARKKAMKIGAAAVGAAAVLIAATAGVLSYLGRNQIHPDRLKEDVISVWLPSDGPNELAEELAEAFQKNCPQISLDITEIPREEYKDKLAEACEDGSLPDVFCTDGLPGEASEYCGSAEKLYETLDMEAYPYLEEAEDHYQVPTGIQIALVYENTEKFQEKKQDMDESLTEEELRKMPNGEWAVMESYEDFGSSQSSLRVIAGDLTCFEDVKDVTVRAVPPKEFHVVPYLDKEGSLPAVYCGNYGVNKDSSGNRQEAGMLCISYLLSKRLQQEAYISNYEGIPIREDAREDYAEVKFTGYLRFAEDYLDQLVIDQKSNSIEESCYRNLNLKNILEEGWEG